MRVGVVGCGQIGRRRAQVVQASPNDQLRSVADLNLERARSMGSAFGCSTATEWRALTSDPEIDAVVIATTHDALAEIGIDAAANGKHVLVEKPMAWNADEAAALLAAVGSGLVLKVGYNHRHHPALVRAHSLVKEGEIGQLLFIRCRYGHGGRPGYEREWRADRRRSGGGELLDQGIHGIDLGRWFLGDFAQAVGMVETYAWESEGADTVEDNAFALLRTGTGQTMSLHASWTQWKNLFSFEVFGDRGFLLVEGLGGSYGTERLTFGCRNTTGGPPVEWVESFDEPDRSWEAEWSEFAGAIETGRQPPANGEDGLAALKAVEAVYQSSVSGSVTAIE